MPAFRESWESIPVALRLVLMGVAGAFVSILLFLLPDLIKASPLVIQLVVRHPLFWIALAMPPACLGAERFAAWAPLRWADRAAARAKGTIGSGPDAMAVESWAGRLAAVDRRADPAAARLLGTPLAVAVGLVCAVFLLTWAPHYLTWPFWVDTEQFAISAQSWASGIRPYRDLADFDFPGPIYLLYGLGAAFGWGRTVPFYAADLALLLLLGGALMAWSRRVFGAWLPGMIAFVAWLCFYLEQDYPQVAQRDWQGPALAVLGLLALEAMPGRWARPLSALCLAGALAYRPQPVLFLPAFLSAVEESARRPGKPAVQPLRAAAWWSAALVVSLVAVCTPLIAAGVLDDLIRAMRITGYGGSYNRTTWYISCLRFKSQFWDDWIRPSAMASLILLAAAGPPALRRLARTWMLALLGALCYKPISPVQHTYLNQPVRLVLPVGMAVLAAWLLAVPRLTASVRLAGLVVLLAIAVPAWPRFCTARGSLEALGPLSRGEIPEKAPPGCRKWYPRVDIIDYGDPFPRAVSYDYWDDYRRVLLYLRDDVDHCRPVANLLRSMPLPPVNGPSGHLSPFPAAGGCVHLVQVDPSLEGRFVEALERTPGTLVVWTPSDPMLIKAAKFPRLEAAVRRWYRPCKWFGHIQVWVRSDEAGDEVRRGTTGFES